MIVFPGTDGQGGGEGAGGTAAGGAAIPRGPGPGERPLRGGGPHAGEPLDDTARALRLAFAPLHKRAFGLAVGTACGLFLFAWAAFHIVFEPVDAVRIELLRAYFYGFGVSWTGALIGTAWAFGVGFVMGWFAAFCRNLIIAVSVFLTRTRAELEQTREFLDHI